MGRLSGTRKRFQGLLRSLARRRTNALAQGELATLVDRLDRHEGLLTQILERLQTARAAPTGKPVESWKQIASILGVSVRTAQRWARADPLFPRLTKGVHPIAFAQALRTWNQHRIKSPRSKA